MVGAICQLFIRQIAIATRLKSQAQVERVVWLIPALCPRHKNRLVHHVTVDICVAWARMTVEFADHVLDPQALVG